MKKTILIIFMIMSLYSNVFSQGMISNDGRYVCVDINKSNDQKSTSSSLIIQSTASAWKRQCKNAQEASFTNDSKHALFLKGDTLFILTLGTNNIQGIPNVDGYKQPKCGSGKLVAYRLKNPNKQLHLLDLSSHNELKFEDVSDYYFNEKGAVLLVSTLTKRNSDSVTNLLAVNLKDNSVLPIWSGKDIRISDCTFDSDGKKLAFIVTERHPKLEINTIWSYNTGTEKAQLLVSDKSNGVDSNLTVEEGPIRFIGTDHLLFYLKEKEIPESSSNSSKEDLWSYTDAQLHSIQLNDAKFVHRYNAVACLSQAKVIKLEDDNEILATYPSLNGRREPQIGEKFALIYHFEGDIITYGSSSFGLYGYGDIRYGNGVIEKYSMNEYNWNRATRSSVFLLSLKDGTKQVIKNNIRAESFDFPYFRLSSSGEFVVYYDQTRSSYYSYEINSGVRRNITKRIATIWTKSDPGASRGEYCTPVGIANWLKNDAFVLITDSFGDIWKVDPLNLKSPVNITNGYARKNHVFFQVLKHSSSPFDENQEILLTADITNSFGNVGYYKKILNKLGDPVQLIKYGGPYSYNASVFKKADSSNVYLISRQNHAEAENYFFTTDFSKYQLITDGLPDGRVGIKKELVTWDAFDGKPDWGVLYKPQDFNPHKKYPVIIYYYERNDGYDVFETYDKDGGIPGIDTGYLYFVPSVRYKIGETGPCVYNCVVSGAKYLSKLPYVDAKHMGIKGGSFGGYETNYLVTHTNLFAAASSVAGASDLISLYGTEDKDVMGYNNSAIAEIGQLRIGADPWARPDLYFKNSPVFHANRVTTPLLISANRTDFRVPFSQSVEMFKALRRMGKKVWLLAGEVKNRFGFESHGPAPGYEIHLRQFFDHYLKGKPAPKWMTRGIPAGVKGIDDRLDLDYEIKTPGTGLLMDKEITVTRKSKLWEPKGQKIAGRNGQGIINKPIQKSKKSKTFKKITKQSNDEKS